jgi:hypothetical protein
VGAWSDDLSINIPAWLTALSQWLQADSSTSRGVLLAVTASYVVFAYFAVKAVLHMGTMVRRATRAAEVASVIKADRDTLQARFAELESRSRVLEIEVAARKPASTAYGGKPEQEQFTEASFDNIHWRWSFDFFGRPQLMKPYCEVCDFDLPKGSIYTLHGQTQAKCSHCGYVAHLKTPNKDLSEATAGAIQHALRNGTWKDHVERNARRQQRIEAQGQTENADGTR